MHTYILHKYMLRPQGKTTPLSCILLVIMIRPQARCKITDNGWFYLHRFTFCFGFMCYNTYPPSCDWYTLINKSTIVNSLHNNNIYTVISNKDIFVDYEKMYYIIVHTYTLVRYH